MNTQDMTVDGIIVWRGIRYCVCIDWAYLVMDTVRLAENVRQVEFDQIAECNMRGESTIGELHRKTALAIDNWLRNLCPTIGGDCYYAPLLHRQHLSPLCVSWENHEAYVEALLCHCIYKEHGSPLCFVFDADEATLVVDHRLALIARYSATHVKVKAIYCGSIIEA